MKIAKAEHYWAMVLIEVDDPQHSEELLSEIVDMWVTVRGFAMTSSWLENSKRASQKTTATV